MFIASEMDKEHLVVILSTHSTSLLGALARKESTRVAFMRRGDKELKFRDMTDIHKRVLPMFGAHPLSNIFNEAPILLVEGEDDERIWQQAVRTSIGRICVYPCVADSVDRLGEFETEANNIIDAVYDNARGYSLRDRDIGSEAIDDVGHIVRMCLSCRASENLMLSDDVLKFAGTNWNDLQDAIRNFVAESSHHPYHKAMKTFLDEGLDRKGADLKDIRMVLAGFISKKPWEVLVGQAIAALDGTSGLENENSLPSYLGQKVCQEILSR